MLLPERMATHFGGNGQANGWMTRSANLHFLAAMGVGLSALFFILGIVTRFIPARFVNIPNREYWLSPERRVETSAFISRQLLWMGCLMILFLAGIHYSTILANRTTPAHLPLDLFLGLLGGFLIGVGAWSIGLVLHFRKMPK